jgi:hypothetical protein
MSTSRAHDDGCPGGGKPQQIPLSGWQAVPVASRAMTQDPPGLPPTPLELIDLLRRLEGRLDDLDAVREEVRAVRQALETEQTEDAVVSVATIHTVVSFSDAAYLELSGQGTATGETAWHGETSGEAPVIEGAPTREWLTALRRRGGQAAKAADVVGRIIYLAAKLGEPFS